MADTGRSDGTDDGPSLAMPSFSLRRRKKQSPQAPADAPSRSVETPALAVPGVLAAAVTGVLVGGLAVVLTWLATTACDAVGGTSSCGRGPGLLVLAAMLVLLAWVGGLLLRALGAADPGSTSVLAIGILTVLVLVFLLGSIDEWWMVVAVPATAAVAFCASWWVTTSVVGDDVAADAREVR